MSWDIFALDIPPEISNLKELPEDFASGSLGKKSTLIERIKAAVPEVNFSDPSWGKIQIPNCEIEINLGEGEEVDCIAFHVYSGGLAPGVVMAILKALKLRALDSQTGELFNEEQASESFEKWMAYRNRVTDSRQGQETPFLK